MLIIEELNLYANAKIAKIIATFLVIFFICYHGFLHAIDGGDSCHRLLSDGRFQGSLVWQPYGCMLHSYSHIDSRRCFKYVAFLKETNSIVFVGDSRIRQIYIALLQKAALNPPKIPEKAHNDMHYNDTNLLLQMSFLWYPYMDDKVQKQLTNWKFSKTPPKLLIIGTGSHSIKSSNGSMAGFEEYKYNLSSIASSLDHLTETTRVLWMLQDPVVPERLHSSRSVISNDQIDLYNMAAIEILRPTRVNMWSSSRLIAQGSLNGFSDGLHAGTVALNYDIQVLLNLYCNNNLNYDDGTCCNTRESFTLPQIIVFATLCTCSIIVIVVSLKQWICATTSIFQRVRRNEDEDGLMPNGGDEFQPLGHHLNLSGSFSVPFFNELRKQPEPSGITLQDVFMAIGKLGLIMGYFFLCDRTSLFMKENKYFTQLNFWLPLGYIFALGIFFTEDTSQTRLLHRDMTNEWKGWMQLVILIYNMTGASQVLSIYMHVRIIISSYLVLIAYGHFSFYWAGQDMGLVRYLQVMFRLNFLTVLLCMIMNQPYQFYYYVPLVSFWYSVLHLTLVLPPRLSQPSHVNSEPAPSNYFYCIIKILLLGGVITVLYLSEVFFEKVFVLKLWRFLFVSADDDIHEWWFRWQLDRYSLIYGLCFALLYQGLSQWGFLEDKSGSNLLVGRLGFLACVVSVFFCGSYTLLSYFCGTKIDCNEVHPYMVWVPIFGYIMLRNIFGLLRTRYSTFFAWFGQISLELFVCQYHIWLAADTHGVLVLIPSYPVANVLVTSFIFLCVCHEIHHITNVLVQFIVPFNAMKAVRNLSVIIFVIILVPNMIPSLYT